MRILLLFMFPLYGNGSASFLRAITHELVKKGHSVAIVAPDKRKLPGVKHYVVEQPYNGVFIGHPELANAKKFKDMSGKELGAILSAYLQTGIYAVDDFKPDIIHSFHTAFLPPVSRILKILFGMRIIITTHGSDLVYLTQDRRLNGLIGDASRVAAQITANSEFTEKGYLELFGHGLKKRMRVITGGVRLDDFVVNQRQLDEVDRKYNLKGKQVVLFTGRLIKGKGIEYLLKAAPKIDGTVVIVGDGPEKKHYEAIVKRNRIKNVLFTGYMDMSGKQSYLTALYNRAAVYVSPSIWEGFGLTILEAMASHTPVVASNQGGIVSIIKNESNGLLIPTRNSKAIAEAVNRLLHDDALRQKLGEAAYKTVVEHFTWEKIAEEFEQLYKEYAFTTADYLNIVQKDTTKTSHVRKMIDRVLSRNV